MSNMLSISFGVAIATYGETKFNSFGVMLQLGVVVFEATRLVLIQILFNSKGISLYPITSLYYVVPCCLVFLSVPWIIVEVPKVRDGSSFRFDYLVSGTNSLCAFGLNLGLFLLVRKTSASTTTTTNTKSLPSSSMPYLESASERNLHLYVLEHI
ncbi:hypothetical protein L6452_05071 [Arctium lappa]|uniref:Uncharacterized protein n=1 Tax=Arctium lappa TaxID=4217 RepID=A0ACB9EFJ1_ARCLA|nr:hypothetical protein L6452_05071 [Arctium lappa]